MIELAIGIGLALLIVGLSKLISDNKRRRQREQNAFWRRVEHIND